jgi:hypothetical protein
MFPRRAWEAQTEQGHQLLLYSETSARGNGMTGLSGPTLAQREPFIERPGDLP